MRKIYLFLILAFLISLNISAKGNELIMESLTMYSNILKQDVKYSICLPEDYFSSKKTYPVVYALHGLGDNESSWIEYGNISQTAYKMAKNKEIVPAIYVMPQGFTNYYVNDSARKFLYQDMFIKELIPFIDKQYRTVADKQHRATIGYSMGGFGALILPLKNPEIIQNCVPLSISIRTDIQYMEEDSSGWNKQWGRLFGGVGKSGKDRITEYYKQNNPFYIFSQNDISKIKDLNIYIDNGDDEQTLCRSNEELHILLRDKKIPHEFRVRDGGHEFSYWNEATINGLKFISDAFEGKKYRGEIKKAELNPYKNLIKSFDLNGKTYQIYTPKEFSSTTRFYPVIYVIGNFKNTEKEQISSKIDNLIETASISPVLLVFLDKTDINFDKDMIPFMEKNFRARDGWRFRALLAFEDGANLAFQNSLKKETFTACAVFDGLYESSIFNGIEKENTKRTWFFIETPDKSVNYKNNGEAHILLRDKDIYHQYRVSEGFGGFEWFNSRIDEALYFIIKKIHR